MDVHNNLQIRSAMLSGFRERNGNQAATASTPKPPSGHKGVGEGMSKNTTKLSYQSEDSFFLVRCSLGCYKPITVFHSYDKVGSDSFCLFFFFPDVSVGKRAWSFLLHNFAQTSEQIFKGFLTFRF